MTQPNRAEDNLLLLDVETDRLLTTCTRLSVPDRPTLCEGWSTRDMAAHLWLREITRVDRAVTTAPAFRWSDALEEDEDLALPAIYCRHCGRSGWGATTRAVGDDLDLRPDTIRKDAAERTGRFRALLLLQNRGKIQFRRGAGVLFHTAFKKRGPGVGLIKTLKTGFQHRQRFTDQLFILIQNTLQMLDSFGVLPFLHQDAPHHNRDACALTIG